jgi:hypothetical protein
MQPAGTFRAICSPESTHNDKLQPEFPLTNRVTQSPEDLALLMSKVSEEPKPPEARYANYFQVGHNAFEFLLDFGQFAEGSQEPQINVRIVTYPVYVKFLLRTLTDAVAEYEKVYGTIPEPDANLPRS